MERVGWVWVWDGTWGEERAEAVLKMERASVPCQPLSCFRGLPGIFLSLPPNMLLISALNQNRSGQKPRGPHCAAADTGQGRDKLLCLDFIIHSWGTRDSRDCCQECPAAPFWGTYKWASVWSWPQETPLIDCRMLHSDTSFFLSCKSKMNGQSSAKDFSCSHASFWNGDMILNPHMNKSKFGKKLSQTSDHPWQKDQCIVIGWWCKYCKIKNKKGI